MASYELILEKGQELILRVSGEKEAHSRNEGTASSKLEMEGEVFEYGVL